MAFYINPIDIQRALLQDRPVKSPESLLRVLAPGETISIEVGDALPEGLMQVLIGGKSYSAELPKGLSKGQTLTAEVVKNTDALVLKLLMGEEELPEGLPPVVSLLKNILPKDKIDLLRILSGDVKEEIKLPEQELPSPKGSVPTKAAAPPPPARDNFFFMPEEAAEVVPSQVAVSPNKAKGVPAPNTPATKEVLKIIENLLVRKSLVLNESDLAAPSKIEHSLLEAAVRRAVGNVEDAAKEVTKLTSNLPSPRLLRVLDSLHNSLAQALESGVSLTFEEIEPPLPPALRMYLEATGQSAENDGIKKLMNAVRAQVKEENPLPLLVRALRLVDLPIASPRSEGEASIETFLRKVAADLDELKRTANSEPEVREGLKKIKKLVRAELDKQLDTREVEAAKSQSQAVKMVEQFVKGQEVLSNVNPVVKLFGEPAVFLFPMMIQGFLSKLELVVTPPDQDGKQKNKGGKSDGYERADIHLDLPSIGGVNVSLAQRKGEIFINVTVSDSKIASFLEGKGELLLARFREHGIEAPVLRVSSGEPKSVVPEWYRDLTRKSVVA